MFELESRRIVDCSVPELALFIILASSLLGEIYINILPDLRDSVKLILASFGFTVKKLQEFYTAFCKTIKDYSSGHYYVPWDRKHTIILKGYQIDAHIRELADCSKLSQRAVYVDIFGFQFNLQHDSTSLDPEEQTPHRYKLFSSVIRTIGNTQLSDLTPYLNDTVSKACHDDIDMLANTVDGWNSIMLAPLMRKCATNSMGVYFFGKALYHEPEFYAATQQFYTDVVKCMGALQFTPSWLRSPVCKYATKNGHALKIMYRKLHEVVTRPDGWQEDQCLRNATMLNHFIEQTRSSTYWTPDLLIQAIVGIFFAASHQPWINLHFIVLELCNRPEYIRPLREEISQLRSMDPVSINKLSRLDSFIKECVRNNPLDRVAVRRRALADHQFRNDGPFIHKGQIVCVDAWGLMHSPTSYPNPNEFDGFRFVGTRQGSETRGSKFVDAGKEFPVWGYGSRVCPGRWHTDLVFKVALIHLLSNYDLRVEDPAKRQAFWWETFQMPFESTVVQFRRLDKAMLGTQVHDNQEML